MPEAQIIPLNGDDRGRGRRQREAEAAAKQAAAEAPAEGAATSSGGDRRSAGDGRTAGDGAASGTGKSGGTPRRRSRPGIDPAERADLGGAAARRAAARAGARATEESAARAAAATGSSAGATAGRAGSDRTGGSTRRSPADRSAAVAEPPAPPAPDPAEELPAGWEEQLTGAMAFLRRRLTGDYPVDEFGFDPDLSDHVLAPLVRPLYKKWFRVEVRGVANVPDTGGALVVANHSGTLPIDGLMTAIALLDEHPAHRHLRALAADLVFKTPFLAPLARKSGNTLASIADAERLLSGGELVGVWPEGFKGVGKPFSERYKLQRFGRGGFVSAALRTGVPIIPCSIVGAEEIYPMIGNVRPLARLLGFPYLPVTPTFPLLGPLGLIPLPSKWIIEFGEPVETASFGPGAADDPMLVFNLTDQVRETIQHSLYRLLMRRRSVFF